jgi:hypothetical protein
MNLFEKWDKALEDGLQRLIRGSLGPSAGSHFLECYERALDDLEAKAQPVGGRKVFGYRRVVLRFCVMSSDEAVALEDILSQRKQLSQQVRKRLELSGCEVASTLRVDASAITSSECGLAAGTYEIFCYSQLPSPPTLVVRTTKGRTERASYSFSGGLINVGRLAEVLGAQRKLLRRNHVAFTDEEEGVASTVSRMHAHIVFDPEAGWYRLYDDGSRTGTRICRDTRVLEVPSGPKGGAWLRRRDQLQFGRALMEVDISDED